MKTWRPYEQLDSSGYVWHACAIYAIAHATGVPMRMITRKVMRLRAKSPTSSYKEWIYHRPGDKSAWKLDSNTIYYKEVRHLLGKMAKGRRMTSHKIPGLKIEKLGQGTRLVWVEWNATGQPHLVLYHKGLIWDNGFSGVAAKDHDWMKSMTIKWGLKLNV